MSMVKFECPSCGQHMETDRARGGDVIHCVGCCSELRIPFSSSKTGLASVERAELLVPANAPQPSDPKERIEATPKPTCPPKPPLHSAPKPIETPCPVCQSVLRFDPGSSSLGNGHPIVELVHRHDTPTHHSPAAKKPHSAQPETQNHHTLSFEER